MGTFWAFEVEGGGSGEPQGASGGQCGASTSSADIKAGAKPLIHPVKLENRKDSQKMTKPRHATAEAAFAVPGAYSR